MDDAYLSSMRINWIETVYFYLFLPLVINRCHYDPSRLRLWKALEGRQPQNVFDIPEKLYKTRAMIDKPTPDHFVYKGAEKINPKALEQVEDIKEIYEQFETGSAVLSNYVNAVLERVKKLESEGVEVGG